MKFVEGFFCWRIVQVDAGDRSGRTFKDDVFHFLNVNLFRFDRIENACQYARPIEMTDHQSMRGRSLACQVHHVRDFACFLELLHDAHRLGSNRLLCLIR